MEQDRLYRSLFLMDDTRNFTNDFYISEFVKIVLYNEGYFALSLEDIHSKIVELTSLEYTEDDILHALSIWNNNEVDVEDGLYSLSSLGIERISKRKNANTLKNYIDVFLKDHAEKYSIKKDEFEELLEKFIYQRFNENLKEISDILNHCLTVDNYDKKYSDEEKEIINDFLAWDNVEKSECIYRLIAKAYDYCMINSKCQTQNVDFSKLKFYLDTNIIFRLMGINGSERENSIKSLIDKCQTAGIKLVVSNFVIEECEYTINSQLQLLIESTASTNSLIPPTTMSFAEEKSIKLDFYRRYYDWVKAGNKHKNYDAFKKYIINQFNKLVESFDIDDENPSFKVLKPSEFSTYYDSLYAIKNDRQTTETDTNSFMLILEKRKNQEDKQDYFLISADQKLVSWSREVFPGQKSTIDFPSVWLSILLKYIGRETESDYKSFCQFIHLSIEPQIEDLENKIIIKASILATDIDDEIKTMMINEVRDNYNQYKNHEPSEIVHIAYAKTKESIENETKHEKDLEFNERMTTVEKEFENLLDQKLSKFKKDSEEATIDAYNRGRKDFADEQKKIANENKINKIIERNTLIRKSIKIMVFIIGLSCLVSWILLYVLGLLESKSEIVIFLKNKSPFFSGISTFLEVFLIVFNFENIKAKILPIDRGIIRNRIDKYKK